MFGQPPTLNFCKPTGVVDTVLEGNTKPKANHGLISRSPDPLHSLINHAMQGREQKSCLILTRHRPRTFQAARRLVPRQVTSSYPGQTCRFLRDFEVSSCGHPHSPMETAFGSNSIHANDFEALPPSGPITLALRLRTHN